MKNVIAEQLKQEVMKTPTGEMRNLLADAANHIDELCGTITALEAELAERNKLLNDEGMAHVLELARTSAALDAACKKLDSEARGNCPVAYHMLPRLGMGYDCDHCPMFSEKRVACVRRHYLAEA